MKTMTVEDIMKHNPCYKRDRIIELWAGRESLSFSDVAKLDIPGVDKVWAGVHFYMDDRQHRLFAVRCARRALSRILDPNPRGVAACDVAERFANGEASEEELTAARSVAWSVAESAARSARSAAMSAESAAMSAESAAMSAWSAASYAAWSAAESAAESAAMSAAWPSAWSVAESAARSARFEQVKYIIEVMQ